MRRVLLISLLLLAVSTAPVAALTFEETLAEAEAGNPVAQFNLALAYQTGDGIDEDLELARQWYERAVALDYGPAMVNLAYLHAEQANDQEALRLYTLAAEQGEVIAQLELGERYRDGLGTPADPARAAHWYGRAAEQGDAAAMFVLANMYAAGEGVPQDYARAADLFRAAADRGQVEAHCNLGRLYAEGGPGVPQDDLKAIECFRAGAFKGEPVAQYNLGQYYLSGTGVLQDKVKAYSWFRLAAEQGEPNAVAALADLQQSLTATEQAMGDVEAGQLADRIGD